MPAYVTPSACHANVNVSPLFARGGYSHPCPNYNVMATSNGNTEEAAYNMETGETGTDRLQTALAKC